MTATSPNGILDAFVNEPIFDSHSHIDPLAPTARSLDDILGYHYYTELAHSAGLGQSAVASGADPRERCRSILGAMERIDNTAQYGWLLEIARTYLGFEGDRLSESDCDSLYDESQRRMGRPDWHDQVIAKTKLQAVFLTNAFDDPLTGFDRRMFVPCLRTDDLVFSLHQPATRERLRKLTGHELDSFVSIRKAIRALFERFVDAGAGACAISLPPEFVATQPPSDADAALNDELLAGRTAPATSPAVSRKVFWMLAEHCREFGLPFDLMIGVNRRVYRAGVFQGQDLFDHRCSLIQYAELFNSFPEVRFPVSVLTSGPANQELVSYSWIFPNVFPHGHWWYSNVPAYIESDLRARLAAVPKYKLLGYYSDAYKLEFVLPKFNMYRRILAKVLWEDFVRPGIMREGDAIKLGLSLLRDNLIRTFAR